MRDIQGYEGRYAITENGRVWSYPKPASGAASGMRKGLWLKPMNSHGYHHVNLGANNMKAIHRLVATTFLEKVNGKTHVNHKDGNKKNNHTSNLEWCTQAENNIHARLMGLNKPNRKIPESEYSKVLELYERGLSLVAIAKIYSVGASTIGRTLKWSKQVGIRAITLSNTMKFNRE